MLTVFEPLEPAQVNLSQGWQVNWLPSNNKVLLLPLLPHDLRGLPCARVGAAEATVELDVGQRDTSTHCLRAP
jgi:hypothetical protein